jgi:hypothetical protein
MDNLCKCGCGGTVTLSSNTRASQGAVRGQPRKYIRGHNANINYLQRIFNFWSNVRYVDDCIIWTRYINTTGYGTYGDFLGQRYAHKIAYILTFGGVPEGLDLDHLCRNRACINPYHLEPVTRSVNNQRGDKTKIDEHIVRAIRDSSDSTHVLAERYGISAWIVYDVRRGRTWKNV